MSTKNTILSIIIPSYNASAFLERTINSIQGTEVYHEVEIIIINDGSSDNTESVALELSKQHLNIKVISQSNKGVSASRNVGIKEAKGEYVYFMDADDTLDSAFMETIVPILKEESYELIAFGFTIYKKSGSVTKRLLKTNNKELLYKFLLGRIRLAIWSIIVKRSIIEDNNFLFDEKTYYTEDTEFTIKILSKVQKTKIVKESLYNYLMLSDNSAITTKGYSIKRFSTIPAWVRILKYTSNSVAERRITKAVINRMITAYIIHNKMYTKKSNEEIDSLFEQYDYISKISPPFQMSKFWIYNFIGFLLNRITKFK